MSNDRAPPQHAGATGAATGTATGAATEVATGALPLALVAACPAAAKRRVASIPSPYRAPDRVADLKEPGRWRRTTDDRVEFRNSSERWESRFHVAPSRIGASAGLGLFAARSFKAGENVSRYMGHTVGPVADEQSLMRVDSVCGQGEHTLQMGGLLVDGLHGRSGAQYMNSAYGPATGANNVAFNANGTVVATRTIAVGDELLVAYGARFWRGVQAARAWAEANPVAADALRDCALSLDFLRVPERVRVASATSR